VETAAGTLERISPDGVEGTGGTMDLLTQPRIEDAPPLPVGLGVGLEDREGLLEDRSLDGPAPRRSSGFRPRGARRVAAGLALLGALGWSLLPAATAAAGPPPPPGWHPAPPPVVVAPPPGPVYGPVYGPPPAVVYGPPPPPLPVALRVIYAPFYVTGLVIRYGLYYGIVAPLEVLGRAIDYGVEGGVPRHHDD